MTMGVLMLLAAAALAYGDHRRSECAGQASEEVLMEMEQQDEQPLPAGSDEMPVQRIDGRDYIGVLEIPAKELTLPVISDWSDEALQIAPCRYAGTLYGRDLVIAGHNYARHFSAIKTLRAGDDVIFCDAAGTSFSYEVDGVEKVSADDVQGMLSGEWDMTLFTCSYGGRDRIAVRCIMK